MRILVTGAAGFLGRMLVERLMKLRSSSSVVHLDLVDLDLSSFSDEAYAQVGKIELPLEAQELAQRLQGIRYDVVFHLAGVTSQNAQQNFEMGLTANVLGSINLLEILRRHGNQPKLVFTSSIGVYGVPLPSKIDDVTPIAPTLSYGSQKRAIEVLLADYARRQFVDARTVRLPGVIARPANAIKAFSTFSSDILHTLAAGQRYTCPVSAQATNWLISVQCCLDQLLHASRTDSAQWPESRVVNLPAQRVTTAQLVAGLEQVLNKPLAHLVEWAPIAEIEAQFGSWPPLETVYAEQLGLQHDGSPENLVKNALQL